MICPACLKEIPSTSTTCPFCGQTSLSGDPLSATPAMRAAPPPAPAREAPAALKILAVTGGFLCVFIIVMMSAYVTRKTHTVMDAQAIGYAVGMCIGVFLLPVIGVLIYAKVNKRKHVPAYLFGVTCGIALFWSFLGILPQLAKQSASSPDKVNERIATLAKEATGQQPNSGNQEKYDDIIRPFFADIKKFNDEYMEEVNKLDNSALKTMYGAKSFDGDETISRVLEQLHATQNVDQKYASMDPLLKKTKDRLFASSASQEEKEAFWNGFESSFKKSLQPREEANAKEQLWLNDSIGLYEFMQANEKSFHVKNNKIVFGSGELLNEYNEKYKKVDAERKDFLAAKQSFEKAQKEGLGKIGLKPSDFDAPTHN
ncbi:MAG TPA: hypothetical protein VN025_16465 [Candidatus Dormibacteraeota bacterium]|jgi:hypothetical protein|nr:hypothetical protein [Candidatus Dormibacteraeota bacterium]